MLVVAYDGTNYRGWQVQPHVPTIEGELNRHLSALLQEEIIVIGASRTDTGVHALGNIAVFDTGTAIPGEKISYALNQRLPEDICIQKSAEVAGDFHPRHCDSRKTYEYRVLNATFPLPTKRLDHYFAYQHFDLEAMKQGAAYLIGEHDFRSFCTAYDFDKNTVRTIYSLDIRRENNESGSVISFRICGNGFLYNMVRIIVGTLLEIGRGRYAPEQINQIFAAKKRSAAGFTVPAKGLTLLEIEIIRPENL